VKREGFVRPELLTMSMPPHQEGPSLARRFVAHALALVGLEDDEPDAALVVSELVGNACRYARSQVTVRVAIETEDGLRIEIEDDGPGMPSLRPAEPVDTAGRGLQIVSTIAESWGTIPTEDGKVVWVELTHHTAPCASASA
jgi:anti-sigma regulatory factor (Ser/Thr protein kinase)